MSHIADNHDALLDYLYEEGSPADRLKIAKHLQECAACSVAVLEFQNVRGMLRDWTPPASELGFRLVQDGQAAPVAPPAVWTSRFAGWSQAAAAVVLFAAGMAVSQLSVDYSDGAVRVQMRPGASDASLQPVSARARTSSILLPAETAGPIGADAMYRELRDRVASSTASSTDTEQLLQRVRAMIDQSEQRQQRELALRLSQVASEVDTQHQADLLSIQQNMGQQQDDFMNYLVRTGSTK